jgi:hypothetical protein
MATIRKIVTSKIDGSNANNTDTNEIRPFGETAFYLDANGGVDQLTLMMFDGRRTHLKSKVLKQGVLFGSNADSGDGNELDTIKLIPDAELYDNGSDQYLIIDPTVGEPGHIHIRAGGTQDDSSADLYLGAEQTYVRVSDTNREVNILTTLVGEGQVHHNWTFDDRGRLIFPSGGAIESVGMGWIGLTNGDSNTPVSISYKKNDGESPVGLSEIFLLGSNTAGSVNIYTQDLEADVSHQWIFSDNGDTVIPGAVIKSTDSRVWSANGIPTGISDVGGWTDIVDGSYGPFTLSGVTFNVTVASQSTTYDIVSSNGIFTINQTIGTLSATDLGGSVSHESNISVTNISNPGNSIELRRSINKLSEGIFTLDDGVEGQIMYLVKSPNVDSSNVFVSIENGDGSSPLMPFMRFGGEGIIANDGICTLIFTDGTWKQTGGIWD